MRVIDRFIELNCLSTEIDHPIRKISILAHMVKRFGPCGTEQTKVGASTIVDLSDGVILLCADHYDDVRRVLSEIEVPEFLDLE